MKFERVAIGDVLGDHVAREGRSPRIVRATIRNNRIAESVIVIRNMSRMGIGGKLTSNSLRPGEAVVVSLDPVGEIEGTVRWVRGDRFGVQLHDELVPERFDFTGSDWSSVTPPLSQGHVYDLFKPTKRAWRPGIKSHYKK
jgi:hypothetical protein